MLRRVLLILILAPSLLSAQTDKPATRPTALGHTTLWLDHALDEAAKIEDPVRQSDVYAKAALLMARGGDVPGYRRTIAVAEQALARAPIRPDQSPVDHVRELAAAPVLRAMARAGDVAGARAFAAGRAKGNVRLRPGDCAAIAAGQVEAADLAGALETANALNEYDRRPVLRAIVESLVARKDFAEAERVTALLEHKSLDWKLALRDVAAGRARAGEYEAALAVANRLPYATDKQAVYHYVIDAHVEAKDFRAALGTAAKVPLGEPASLPPEYSRALAYSKIGHAQLAQKDIAGATDTAALFEGELKHHLLRDIAKAQIQAGDLAAAGRTADAIPRDGVGSGGTSPWQDAREAAALAHARAGEIAVAIELARELRNPAGTLIDIAELAVRGGKPKEARQIVRELADDGDANGVIEHLNRRRVDPSGIRLARIQKALGNPAPYDNAVAQLRQRANEPGDPEARRMAAMQLLGVYIGEENYEAARQLASAVPPEALSWAVALAAEDAVRANRLDRATAVAELMPTPAGRATVLQSILTNAPGAQQTVESAVERIRSLPNAYDRSLAYLDRAERAWIESKRSNR